MNARVQTGLSMDDGGCCQVKRHQRVLSAKPHDEAVLRGGDCSE